MNFVAKFIVYDPDPMILGNLWTRNEINFLNQWKTNCVIQLLLTTFETFIQIYNKTKMYTNILPSEV